MDGAIELDFRRHAEDLRQSWQGRALAETHSEPIGLVVKSILAHNFDDAFPILCAVVFPGFGGLYLPGFTSAAKVDKGGHIVADFATESEIIKDYRVFASEFAMQSKFRKLADRLKFTDQERFELFLALRRWVVADRRLDPTMDPRDPDAKRITCH